MKEYLKKLDATIKIGFLILLVSLAVSFIVSRFTEPNNNANNEKNSKCCCCNNKKCLKSIMIQKAYNGYNYCSKNSENCRFK